MVSLRLTRVGGAVSILSLRAIIPLIFGQVVSSGQVTLPSFPMGNCFGRPATAPSELTLILQQIPTRSSNTGQTNLQTSIYSSEANQTSSIWSSQGSYVNYSPVTTLDNRGTVTTSAQLVRSQDWETSQDPRRNETLLNRAPLHLSRRMTRMNSENIFGNGRTPLFGPFLIPVAGQVPVGGQEGRQRFPSTLQSLLSNERYAGGRCPISP